MLFSCYFCTDERGNPGKKFEADAAVCPDCGADGSHPRMKDRVVKLETIHFHPPSKFKGIGVGYLSCSQAEKFPDPKGKSQIATGEPHLVNCPNCKKSTTYLEVVPIVPVMAADADFVLQPATAAKE